MNIKPLFEEPGWKPQSRKFLPPVGRKHTSESNILHRRGTAVRDQDGREIGRKDASCKTNRKTLCGLRDKMALAGSSAKSHKLVNTNGHVDRKLDVPTVCLTAPAPRVARFHRGSSLRRNVLGVVKGS